MSLLQLEGVTVVSGTLSMPRVGRWMADLELETAPPKEGARATLKGPSLSLAGYVARSSSFHGAHRVRLFAGAGGLHKPLAPQAFRSMPVSLLLDELLGAVQERRSPLVDAGVLERELTAWVRPAGTAAEALTSLCDELGVTWRAQPDGAVWLGVDDWRASAVPGEVLDADPVRRVISAALDTMALLPGSSWKGSRVESVLHTIDGTGFRTEILTP